jgi:hypothetical protein
MPTIGMGPSQSMSLNCIDQFNVVGNSPPVVADFGSEIFRVSAEPVPFEAAITQTSVGLATMIDSDGILKWAAHNLAINSEAPATQNITVTAGADYTIEVEGVGSVALTNAATGTVEDGLPVVINALTATLVLTVVGVLSRVWVYRSDLGGMVRNIATNNSYVPTAGVARYLARRNSYVWRGGRAVRAGLRHESAAATNLIVNSAVMVTQPVTTTPVAYTLTFTGLGTVTLSGSSTAGPLVGTGEGEGNRVSLTFTPGIGVLVLTVTGSVLTAQLEVGSVASSYIQSGAAAATRPAETLVIPAANLPAYTDAVSVQIDGDVTYADTNAAAEVTLLDWRADANNLIDVNIDTTAGASGKVKFKQSSAGVADEVETSATAYAPGANVPFNVASRNTNASINGANRGAKLTANTTPTSIADLSAADMNIAPKFNGNIKKVRVWGVDVGDVGIEVATS